MKKLIALTLVLITLCPIVAYADNVYTLFAIVIGWETINDTDIRRIDCLAEDGNVWSFYDDCCEWHIESALYMTMRTCADNPYNDEVIDVQHAEELTAEELYEYLKSKGW